MQVVFIHFSQPPNNNTDNIKDYHGNTMTVFCNESFYCNSKLLRSNLPRRTFPGNLHAKPISDRHFGTI